MLSKQQKLLLAQLVREHKLIYLFGATFIKNDELSKVSSVGKDSHTIKWCWCKHRQWPNPPMFYGPKFAGLVYTQKRKQIKEDWCRGDRRNLLQGSGEILKVAFLLLLHALLCLVLFYIGGVHRQMKVLLKFPWIFIVEKLSFLEIPSLADNLMSLQLVRA